MQEGYYRTAPVQPPLAAGDFALGPEGLERVYGEEHPFYTRDMWGESDLLADTYWEWVYQAIQQWDNTP